MKRLLLTAVALLAITVGATPFAFAQEVRVSPSPRGMVLISGGEFMMGAATNGHGSAEMAMPSNDAEPIHPVFVDDFWIDVTTLTKEQFEEFVKATGYVTVAERTPTKEEFPTAPPENLVAGSVVFAPPDHEVALNDHFQWWSYVKGASWRHPLGPEAISRAKKRIQLCTSHTRMRKLTRNGPGNGCQPKLSLSSPRVAVWREKLSSGAMIIVQTENGWRIPMRESFPFETEVTMDSSASRRSRSFHRALGLPSAWQARTRRRETE